MLGEITRRVIRGRRRALIGWSIGIVLLVGLIALSYPAVRDQTGFQDLLDDYPDFIKQILGLGGGLEITSPAGYLNSQLFTNTLPILLLIFTIGFAVKETAGEEKDNTMDLTLAHPVTRDRFLVEKFVSLTATSLWLTVVSVIPLILLAAPLDLSLPWWALAGATFSVFLLALAFGTMALAAAALTGNRALGIGIAAGLAVAMFVLWGLAPLVDVFEPTNAINLFFWAFAGDPVLHGVQVGNALVLAATTAVLVGIAIWGLRRRDLAV